MGQIMGMGSTHWPAMIQPDEAKPWPFLRTLAHDPRVPEAAQGPPQLAGRGTKRVWRG